MADAKTSKKKKGKKRSGSKATSTERRFLPKTTEGSREATIVGFVGSLLLGAGVFGQWIEDPAVEFARLLLVVGAVLLVGALVFWDAGAVPIRVGFPGVALERKSEIARIPWCDLESITEARGALVLESPDEAFRISLRVHPNAAAWILAEAVQRVPAVLDVKQDIIDTLPEPKAQHGEQVPIEMLQVAGRRCAESKKSITMEGDARLCPTCAQVYHKTSVPKNCVTCGDTIAGRVVQI